MNISKSVSMNVVSSCVTLCSVAGATTYYRAPAAHHRRLQDAAVPRIAMADVHIRVGRPDDAKVLTAYNVAMAKVSTLTFRANTAAASRRQCSQ